LDNVEQGERVEAELDRLIEKRHNLRRQSEGERRAENLWEHSVRCYNARRGEEYRADWYDYEMRLYRIHSGLASEHLARAERLENGHHRQEEQNGHHGD
jgi:hypothetical protein